jgi:ATP-dependent Clp protease protease subunit
MPLNAPVAAPGYEIRSPGPAEAEVYIYDAVGEGESCASRFVTELNAVEAATIHVRLNTPGGDVFDGLAIYNALRNHPAKVVTHIDGIAASMGSVLALAGDEVRMSANAFLMIHNPLGQALGGTDAIRQYAGMMEKVEAQMVAIYARRTRQPPETIREWMDAETWFSAAEAQAAGFVDFIDDAPAMAAAFPLSPYKNVPARLRAGAGVVPAPRTKEPPTMATTKTPGVRAEDTPAAPAETPPKQEAAPPAAPAALEINTSSPDYLAGYAAGDADGFKRGYEQAISELQPAPAEDAPADVPAETTPAEEAPPEMAGAVAAESPADVTALRKAFPGDDSFVVDMVAAKAGLLTAKARYADVLAARLAAANARADKAERALAAEAASPSPVRLAARAGAGNAPQAAADADDPKAKAEAEWDNDPAVRAGFSKKENFVACRVAELTGKLRIARGA